jgi:anti-sigma factor RsiW
MNRCTDSDTRELLPDLLHGTLAADARGRVEAHLATCDECREELDVLRTIKTAAVFAPRIDVDRVVRQIPPYRTIVPVTERPATTRVVSWLVAATMAIVVIGGGSLVLMKPRVVNDARPVASTQRAPAPNPAESTQLNSSVPAAGATGRTTVASAPPHPRALALAANVDDLSDGDLRQLMNDMNRFDALPASEPEPVISVDSGTSLEQDLR